MKTYESMKLSTVFWLGMIPEHWECLKIGSLFSQRKVKVSDKDYAPLSVTKMGILPQLENAAKTNDGDNRKLVCAGDFVINSRSDRKGSCGVSELDGSVSLINLVLTPRSEWNNRYAHYLLRSQPFSEEYYRYGRGIVADLWTTRFSEMKNILLPVPPREEQDQIVRFLDWKVSEINRLIAIIKSSIRCLHQAKSKLINNCITSVTSRIKLKHIARCNCATLGESTEPEYSFRYIDIGSVDYTKGITKYETFTFKNAPSRARRIVKKHDIIISTVRTYLKAITTIYDDADVIVSTGFAVVQPDPNLVDSRFLEYCCKSDWFCDEVIRHSNGVAYPAITSDALMNLQIPFCSYDEQKAIVSHLDVECSKLDCIISNKEKTISKLQELKNRLISDVVTGKIDVRGIEIPEYTAEEADTDSEAEAEELDEGGEEE